MNEQAREPNTRALLREAMHAILSDDHSHERGLATLRELVDRIAGVHGTDGLAEFTAALSLELGGALERIAGNQGLAAADLAELWFAD